MLQWVFHIFIDAVVLFVAARNLEIIHLKGFKTAIVVALLIGILSFFLSWLLTAILHLATLGIFYFLGLGFITRLIVNTIIIEIADKLTPDFKTDGFGASFFLALIISSVSLIFDALLF